MYLIHVTNQATPDTDIKRANTLLNTEFQIFLRIVISLLYLASDVVIMDNTSSLRLYLSRWECPLKWHNT